MANSATYTWTVPLASTGSQIKVKVSSVSDGSVADASNANFSVAPQGTLDLLTPDTGETLNAGSVYAITWTTTGNPNNVKLEYSSDGGATYPNIIVASTPASAGTFDWTVADAIGNAVRVKISDPQSYMASDASQGNFTIAGIKVTAPVGGELWTVGTIHSITWTWAGFGSSAFVLKYATDGLNYTNTISANTGSLSSGNFNWTVADAIGSMVRVSVTKFGAATNDTSDANFTIDMPKISNVTLTPPSGETEYFVGDKANISWTWVGSLKGNTKVSYSTDSPTYTNWTPCAGASALVNTTTLFDWTVPADAVSSNLTKIKIEDTDSGRGASANTSITYTVKVLPTISIAALSGQDSGNWKLNKQYSISWTANEGVHAGALKVEWSATGGTWCHWR